jgi:anti-sigma regulatory factor (Ser/Thr protein kinase)
VGIDPDDAVGSGHLVALDAAETLASFTLEGVPSPSDFERVVTALLAQAAAGGRAVRVFGEMVSLLWDLGEVVAAIELEAMWCDLGERWDFRLLCSYPAALVLGPGQSDAVNEVCRLHSRVSGHAGIDAPGRSSVQAFPATPASVEQVRALVTAMLADVEDAEAIDDAVLVTSELAANAVRHTASDFLVEARLDDGALHVAVVDGHPYQPGSMVAEDESGRGLLLVAAVSRRWGVERLGTGKVVWAEVPVVR